MIRIPVTSADFDSGRIKSSISKLSKHHPDKSVKPKRSFAQQTFAQILGYGGYEELRSQAKHNGPAYSGQSLAIEQFIAPISLRISRYWGVSSDKAEHIAAALGLIHLDAFRATARTIQQPLMRENRVSPPGHLPSLGISPGPIFDAIRRATVMPLAQLEAFQDAMKSMVHIAAIQDAIKPSAQMKALIAAIPDAIKPSAQMTAQIAAIQDAIKPSAQMTAQIAEIQDAIKPSAQMTAQIAAIQEAIKPSAQMTAQIAAFQDAIKPTAQMTAQMAAIQDAMKPMANIAAILDALKSTPH
jgi:hypothetical protein